MSISRWPEIGSECSFRGNYDRLRGWGASIRLGAIGRRFEMGGQRIKSLFVWALMAVFLACLSGCEPHAIQPVDDPNEMQDGGVSGLNYTPYYIATFGIAGDNGISGAGPNISPATPSNTPTGGGGEMCCISFPKKWRPGLKVSVHWIANKKLDGNAWGSWYKADAEIAEYGPRAGAMFVIFLPGDRIKVMVQDENANGHNSLAFRPADSDPYIAVGKVDDEANREEEAARLVRFGEVIKADPSIGDLKQ
ncbi:DUF3304 domain-containing protein [Cupriavidus necator]